MATKDLEDSSQIIPNIYPCFLHTDSQNEMPKCAKQEDKVETEYSNGYKQTEGMTTILQLQPEPKNGILREWRTIKATNSFKAHCDCR